MTDPLVIIVKNHRTHLIALLAFAGLFLAGLDFASAADYTLATAINKAGRQRMLTQCIVKAYSQVGQRITPRVSRRQRMLSQQLAKYYLLRAWGMESPSLSKEIGSARTEFDGALTTLRSAPGNTAEIKRELDAVAVQWEWFQNSLELGGGASYGLIVVSASEAILNSMEVVTSLYERLPVR